MVAPSIGTIAIVDDELLVRKALARLLRSVGYKTEQFASGAEFVRALSRQEYPCLILDLDMPDMSGLEVQADKAVRETGAAIIIITAHDDTESRDRCLAAGAFAYLCKPVDDTVLLAVIDSALVDMRRTKGHN